MAYSYFAFLDVMGYRYYLKKDKQEGTETFREKLIASYRVFEGIDLATLRHKSISDSIFMSSANNISDFLQAAKGVYLSFLQNGLLIRGGIAYNKHFENQHITYSHALTDAYNLESSKSLFPRVLIDKSVIQKLRNESEPPTSSPQLQNLINEKIILKCGNHYQLHILDDDNWESVYNNAKSIFQATEGDIREDPKLMEYHLWLQGYIFNFKPSNKRKNKYIDSFELLES